MALGAFAWFHVGGPMVWQDHLLAIGIATYKMVMKRRQHDGPELLQEQVILVGMEEMVKVGVDALKAGIDAGCLPLDKGLQDLVSLAFLQMEKAGGGMLGYEFQGLEHSDPGFFGREVWKLVLDLSEGLGVGLRLGIELVMVTVLSRSVLPNTTGKVLELLYIWSIELAVGINASEGGTAPPVLLVVPEMAEGCLI